MADVKFPVKVITIEQEKINVVYGMTQVLNYLQSIIDAYKNIEIKQVDETIVTLPKLSIDDLVLIRSDAKSFMAKQLFANTSPQIGGIALDSNQAFELISVPEPIANFIDFINNMSVPVSSINVTYFQLDATTQVISFSDKGQSIIDNAGSRYIRTKKAYEIYSFVQEVIVSAKQNGIYNMDFGGGGINGIIETIRNAVSNQSTIQEDGNFQPSGWLSTL